MAEWPPAVVASQQTSDAALRSPLCGSGTKTPDFGGFRFDPPSKAVVTHRSPTDKAATRRKQLLRDVLRFRLPAPRFEVNSKRGASLRYSTSEMLRRWRMQRSFIHLRYVIPFQATEFPQSMTIRSAAFAQTHDCVGACCSRWMLKGRRAASEPSPTPTPFFSSRRCRRRSPNTKKPSPLIHKDPQANARLGRAQLRLGQLTQAYHYFLNAKALEPDNPDVRLDLATSI